MPRWVLGLMLVGGAVGVGAGAWAYKRNRAARGNVVQTGGVMSTTQVLQAVPRNQLAMQVQEVRAAAAADPVALQLARRASAVAPMILPTAASMARGAADKAIQTNSLVVQRTKVAALQGEAGLKLAAATAAVAQNTLEQKWKRKFG